GIAPPAPPAPEAVTAEDIGSFEEIVVSAKRAGLSAAAPVARMVAEQEDLGDLKLYRIPEPVTVAAQSRKQVAMIDRRGVRFTRIYAGSFAPFDHDPDDEPRSQAAIRTLRTDNLDRQGLGLPLPAGAVAVFEEAGDASLLVGESRLADRAIGDEVEIETGESTDVRYTLVARPRSAKRQPFTASVTNARATPETFELAIPYKLASSSAELIERKGRKTWRVTVPANGEAKLDFALRLER
ncbi:MAG TPA: hypothetical protein VM662_07025, partial [Sphingomonas sp.]|nr:hypothetical protein [Sphingomonas sp.]